MFCFFSPSKTLSDLTPKNPTTGFLVSAKLVSAKLRSFYSLYHDSAGDRTNNLQIF